MRCKTWEFFIKGIVHLWKNMIVSFCIDCLRTFRVQRGTQNHERSSISGFHPTPPHPKKNVNLKYQENLKTWKLSDSLIGDLFLHFHVWLAFGMRISNTCFYEDTLQRTPMGHQAVFLALVEK